LDNRTSTNYLISYLVSITNETYDPMYEEFKSCFKVSLHADLHLNENVENANGLVGIHMSGYFFTMGDIDHRYFWKKHMYPPTPPFPFSFLVMKKRLLVL
jgi:hypothetical protein